MAAWIFEVRVENRQSLLRHRAYIAENPVKAGLTTDAGEFPFCYAYLARQKAAGAKEVAEKVILQPPKEPQGLKPHRILKRLRHDQGRALIQDRRNPTFSAA